MKQTPGKHQEIKVIQASNVEPAFWQARISEPWNDYQNLSDSNGAPLRVLARVARTQDGVAVNALMVYRDDGKALQLRDLRRIKFPPRLSLWNLLTATSGEVKRQSGTTPRPGSRGHTIEHWREVYKLWEQAQVDFPRSPIKWIRQQYSPMPPDPTIRRWVKKARQMHDEGNL